MSADFTPHFSLISNVDFGWILPGDTWIHFYLRQSDTGDAELGIKQRWKGPYSGLTFRRHTFHLYHLEELLSHWKLHRSLDFAKHLKLVGLGLLSVDETEFHQHYLLIWVSCLHFVCMDTLQFQGLWGVCMIFLFLIFQKVMDYLRNLKPLHCNLRKQDEGLWFLWGDSLSAITTI